MRKSRLQLRIEREAARARLNEAKEMFAEGYCWNSKTQVFIPTRLKEIAAHAAFRQLSFSEEQEAKSLPRIHSKLRS
jgi:hypothetical protein